MLEQPTNSRAPFTGDNGSCIISANLHTLKQQQGVQWFSFYWCTINVMHLLHLVYNLKLELVFQLKNDDECSQLVIAIGNFFKLSSLFST